MVSSEYVVGRRAGSSGGPVGESHAVLGRATRGEGPFRTECGTTVQVLGDAWPPEGAADGGACPVCCRVTGAVPLI